MSENDVVVEKWEHVMAAVSDIDANVRKNAKGNAAAGVRTRKALRDLRKAVTEIVKLTVVQDKERKAAKNAAKAATKAV